AAAPRASRAGPAVPSATAATRIAANRRGVAAKEVGGSRAGMRRMESAHGTPGDIRRRARRHGYHAPMRRPRRRSPLRVWAAGAALAVVGWPLGTFAVAFPDAPPAAPPAGAPQAPADPLLLGE